MRGQMPNPSSHRRLAAVLAADVVGYSRLMGEDEPGTLASLKRTYREAVEPSVEAFNGRIVKSMGDGYLVEFDSASNSVSCALDWQSRARNVQNDLPAEAQIVFRIGINLGEIHFENGDIFGDGVNVAARLEALDLFSWLAQETGDRLGYAYPRDLEETVMTWVRSQAAESQTAAAQEGVEPDAE